MSPPPAGRRSHGLASTVLLVLLIVAPTLALSGQLVFATVHTSSNEGRTNAWSFERFDCGCPPCDLICPIPQALELDLFIARRDFPPRHVLFTPYGGQELGEVSIFAVTRAPDTDYVEIIDPQFTGDVRVGLAYALKTRTGKYVLFTIYEIGLNTFGFVYRYQDDGSILFPSYTSVQPTTWSGLKRLLKP